MQIWSKKSLLLSNTHLISLYHSLIFMYLKTCFVHRVCSSKWFEEKYFFLWVVLYLSNVHHAWYFEILQLVCNNSNKNFKNLRLHPWDIVWWRWTPPEIDKNYIFVLDNIAKKIHAFVLWKQFSSAIWMHIWEHSINQYSLSVRCLKAIVLTINVIIFN